VLKIRKTIRAQVYAPSLNLDSKVDFAKGTKD
jgi:hypothetical protein